MVVLLPCLSDTARAQAPVLTVTPQTLTFSSVASGASSTTQNVQVSANFATSVVIQVSQSSPWLSVNPAGALNVGTTPTSLAVKINAQALAQGTYQGTFTISVNSSNQVTVTVNATVSGTSLLTANPSTLSYSAVQGATTATPPGTTVQIASSGAPLNYSINGSTQSSGNWLVLGATSGTSGDAGFNVAANPAGLSPGTYTGTVSVQSTTTGDGVQINVTLVITPNVSLSITPAQPPPFLFQIGGTAPAQQQLTVSATGGTLTYSVAVNPAASWLVVSPLTGSAGTNNGTINLNVTPTSLAPGTYTTNVIVTPQNGTALPAVPVTLIVSSNPILQISSTSMSFTAGFVGVSPPDQQVTLTGVGTSNAVAFSVTSDSAWLSAVAGQSVTPATLTVHVNQSGLAPGNYAGKLTIRPANGDAYSLTLTVALSVTTTANVTIGPPVLFFSFQTGGAPPPSQIIQISSSAGQAITFSAAAAITNCPAGWLTASSSATSTPAIVTVSVSTTGMTPGICSGSVTFTYNAGLGQQSVSVPVTVAVSASAELSVSLPAGIGNQSVQAGSGPVLVTVPLTSTDFNTAVTFAASATSVGGPWLLTTSAGSTTPQNLTVTFLPGALNPGVYTGTVTITSPSLPAGATISIPITLTVLPNVTISVAPASLTFAQPQGGPLPQSQNLKLTASPTGSGAQYQATVTQISGGDWLGVSPTGGSADGATITATVKPNTLVQGTYMAQINLTFLNAATPSATVTATINVGPAQSVTVSSTALTFSSQIGGTAPVSQKLTLTSTGGPVAFTVGTTSSGWLSADITSGTTPKDVNISVNPQGLAVGSYNGQVQVSAPGVLANGITVPVTLTISAMPPPVPTIVTNSASNLAGNIVAGELLTIKGTLLGPSTPVQFKLNAQGNVDSTLGGVKVLFDNIPGIPLYVSAVQINVIAPFELAGRASTNMVVSYNGVASSSIPLVLDVAAPGIFTADSTGLGQTASLNQDGTYNGPPSATTKAAAGGTVMALYATGGGQTSPASLTGGVASSTTLMYTQGQVSVTIGGQDAPVQFSGAAPGLVNGVMQINVTVPTNVHGNQLPVIVKINGKPSPTSPAGPFVAVQ